MADSGAPLERGVRRDHERESNARQKQTLSRHQRITESEVFRKAFDEGRPQVGKFMVLRLAQLKCGGLRLGVVTSRRTFRRAVDRNRARRKLREAYRRNRAQFTPGADVVIVGRHKLLQASAQDVEQELLVLARRAGLMEKDQCAGQ